MCKSMREHDQETRVVMAVEMARDYVDNDTEAINAAAKKCNVTPEFVSEVLSRFERQKVAPAL